MATANDTIGSVVALWRYPVKSMQGEELNASPVTEGGLLGDRAFVLVDAADGKVASAKNPRKWPHLFDFRATYAEPPRPGGPLPPLRITLPDGTALAGGPADRDRTLSAALGRPVSLHAAPPEAPVLEEYWPDIDGLPHRDAVTDEAMPAGRFFDLATVHLLTTATIDRLRELYPAGIFEVRRFRPNVVMAIAAGEKGFVEQGWVGRTVALGDEVRVRITRPCGRCVMTTLPQADLPDDPGILRTAVRQAQGNVGVYASVVQGGMLRRGAAVRLREAGGEG
jgi:uncharacterized protein YcbX